MGQSSSGKSLVAREVGHVGPAAQHLVPGYERHDLKHVLLGYTTDATEEMQMQAFHGRQQGG